MSTGGDFNLLEAYIQLGVQPSLTEIEKKFTALVNKIRAATSKVYTFKVGTGAVGGRGGALGDPAVADRMAAAAKRFAVTMTDIRRGFLGVADSSASLQQRLERARTLEEQIRQILERSGFTHKQRIQLEASLNRARGSAVRIEEKIQRIAEAKTRQQAREAAQLARQQAALARQPAILAQTAVSAGRFRQQMTAVAREFVRIRNLSSQIPVQLQRLRALESQIAGQLANQRLSQRQRLALEKQLVTAAQKRAALERSAAAQTARNAAGIAQGLNRLSLEFGFLFGRTSQVFGNFVRIATAGQFTGEKLGLAKVAATGLGVALSALAAVAKVFTLAAGALVQIIGTGLTIAFHALTRALSFVFAPTLAFFRLIQRLTSYLPLMATALGGLLIRRLIEYSRMLERITNTFRLAFGPDAVAQLDFVRASAARLGLPLQDIADQYSRISFAAQAAGISQKDLRNLFQGVGKASIALGLDAERVGGIFFALEQVISKGTLSSEELRRQLGDRLPGAFQIAARALGITTDELNKLLREGAISSKRFISAFGVELSNTFGPAARRQFYSLTAGINRLKTAVFEVWIAFAQRVKPAIAEVVIELTRFFKQAARSEAFERFTRYVRDQFQTLANNLPRLLNGLRRFAAEAAGSIGRLAKAILVLNGIVMGTMMAAFRAILPLIARFSEQITGLSLAISGIDLDRVDFSLRTLAAAFRVGELALDLFMLRLKDLGLRIQAAMLAFDSEALIFAFTNLGHRLGVALFLGLVRAGHRSWSRYLQTAITEGPAAALEDLSRRARAMLRPGIFSDFQDALTPMIDAFRQATTVTQELQDRSGELAAAFHDLWNTDRLESYTISVKRLARQVGLMEGDLLRWIREAPGRLIGGAAAAVAGGETEAEKGSSQIVRLEEIRDRIEDAILNRERDQAVKDNTQALRENTQVMSSFITSGLQRLQGAAGAAPGFLEGLGRQLLQIVPGGAQ